MEKEGERRREDERRKVALKRKFDVGVWRPIRGLRSDDCSSPSSAAFLPPQLLALSIRILGARIQEPVEADTGTLSAVPPSTSAFADLYTTGTPGGRAQRLSSSMATTKRTFEQEDGKIKAHHAADIYTDGGVDA